MIGNSAPVCIDVGANHGQTIEFLQRLFPCPRIHAIEPSSESFNVLRSKQYGGQVSLYNFALGEVNENRELINYENSCLSSFLSLDADAENRFRSTRIRGKEAVEIRTLDWLVEQNRLNAIDLLKIDAQGYDLNVLRGASDSFRRNLISNVFVELNFVRMYDNQAGVNDIFDFLAQRDLYLVDCYEKVRQDNTLAWCTALFSAR